jgi:DNA-directed RNA polymerase subunit RPC12/RpoP
MTNQQLQTVLGALQEHARYAGSKTVEAIAIIKQMMQAEPGEPGNECPMCNHHQSSISYDCNNCGRSVQIEYTAAPPAQTPPRLSDDAIIEIAKSLGWWIGESDIAADSIEISRAIETAVRKQFGVNE